MNEIEILLEKEIDSDLGSRNKIEELYKNIDSNVSKVVMNFKGVEFMGRSFAQEYLNQNIVLLLKWWRLMFLMMFKNYLMLF